jgi:hypothetical protein
MYIYFLIIFLHYLVNSAPISIDLSEVVEKKRRLADSTNEGLRVFIAIVTSYIFLYCRCC